MNATELFHGFSTPRRAPPGPDDATLFALARPQRITHDGLALAGWSWGAPGPKVLLVHGWESRASHLGRFVAPLQHAGFQVWAFDAPAHGDSEGETSSVIHYGRALLAIAQTYGPFDGLIAHSVGSPAALYAFRHGMRVEASVHIAGPSSLERVLRRTAEVAGLDASELERFHAMVEAYSGEPIATMDLHNLAPSLTHAALLLHDPEDREIPFVESKLLRNAWPHARLLEVHGAGHRRIIGHPDAIQVSIDHMTATIATPSTRLSGSTA